MPMELNNPVFIDFPCLQLFLGMKSTSLLQESRRKEYRYVELYLYLRAHLKMHESTFV